VRLRSGTESGPRRSERDLRESVVGWWETGRGKPGRQPGLLAREAPRSRRSRAGLL